MSYIAATDWNEVTAIATSLLALGLIPTAIGIWVTYKAAKDDLHATQDAAQKAEAAAREQIAASHRPLLIEVAPDGPIACDPLIIHPAGDVPRIHTEFSGGHVADLDPRQVYVHLGGPWASVVVPLRNVGRGLAVIDPQEIRVVGERLGAMHSSKVSHERVPPNESTRILCTPRMTPGAADYPWVWELFVPYKDFAGRQLTVAVVRLIQDYPKEDWRLWDVRQSAPEDVTFPKAPQHMSR
ncbi:MAG TPA: hypothetical protein VMB51_11545 [Solirubrobacteraceae bacterium]|nr:hypothetical protein [Solirubrobacteraceae bacterium]